MQQLHSHSSPRCVAKREFSIHEISGSSAGLDQQLTSNRNLTKRQLRSRPQIMSRISYTLHRTMKATSFASSFCASHSR